MNIWHYTQIYLTNDNVSLIPYRDLVQWSDDLLLNVIAPVLARQQNAIERWFFLRYSENGYHIRLRIRADADTYARTVQPDLYTALHRYREHHPHLVCVEAERYLRTEQYHPELDKYGAEAGNYVAENHFHTSSEIALDVLRREDFAKIPRSLIATALLKITLETVYQEPCIVAAQLMAYASYWLVGQMDVRLLSQAKDQSNKKSTAFAVVEQLCADAIVLAWQRDLKVQLDALYALEQRGNLITSIHSHLHEQASLIDAPVVNSYPITTLLIIPNYVHTLNNRLGLNVLQEVQLALMLYYRWYSNCELPMLSIILEPHRADWLLDQYKKRVL